MKSICSIFLIFVSLPILAKGDFVFATHSRPPLSLYLTEVIQEVFKPYSIGVEVYEMPGSRVISQVNNGQVDGDLSRVEDFKNVSDADTSNYLRVNEPIVLIEIVMVTLAEKEMFLPITWETVNQGTVAFLRGSKTIRKYIDLQNRVALSFSINVLEMVANKRVGSAVMFASVAENLLNQNPQLKEKLVIQRPAILSFNLFMYLNKKHILLIPKIEHSLKQLKNGGVLERIANKYQVIPPTKRVFR